MQTSTQSQPPAVIAQTPTQPASINVTGPDGKTQTLQVPQTRREMSDLMARRSQLSDQLESATGRRDGLVEQIRVAPEAAQSGLKAQLAVLDQRIVQLETDLAATGRQLSSASPALIAATEPPSGGRSDDEFAPGAAVGSVSTLMVLAVMWLVTRRRWRKRMKAMGNQRSDQISGDSAQRLVRVEQGMDAIALEVERISEGQRFVTKLLSESQRGIPPVSRIAEMATVPDKGRADKP